MPRPQSNRISQPRITAEKRGVEFSDTIAKAEIDGRDRYDKKYVVSIEYTKEKLDIK